MLLRGSAPGCGVRFAVPQLQITMSAVVVHRPRILCLGITCATKRQYIPQLTKKEWNRIHLRDTTQSVTASSSLYRRLHTSRAIMSDSFIPPSPNDQPHLMNYPKSSWLSFFSPQRIFLHMLSRLVYQGYGDETFSYESFLDGAEQSARVASDLVSKGEFDELYGLVDEEAIEEIRSTYSKMSPQQRQWISVNKSQFLYRKVDGMMLAVDGNKHLVIVDVKFHGVHDSSGLGEFKGYGENLKDTLDIMTGHHGQLFFCFYRFFRVFSKGTETDWVITIMNHFHSPKDYYR